MVINSSHGDGSLASVHDEDVRSASTEVAGLTRKHQSRIVMFLSEYNFRPYFGIPGIESGINVPGLEILRLNSLTTKSILNIVPMHSQRIN